MSNDNQHVSFWHRRYRLWGYRDKPMPRWGYALFWALFLIGTLITVKLWH